jgi:hypothetical protein
LKKVLVLTALSLLLAGTVSAASSTYSLSLHGVKYQGAQPVVVNGQVMIPIEALKKMGVDVQVDEQKKTVNLSTKSLRVANTNLAFWSDIAFDAATASLEYHMTTGKPYIQIKADMTKIQNQSKEERITRVINLSKLMEQSIAEYVVILFSYGDHSANIATIQKSDLIQYKKDNNTLAYLSKWKWEYKNTAVQQDIGIAF